VNNHLRYGKAYNGADSDVGTWSGYDKQEAAMFWNVMLCCVPKTGNIYCTVVRFLLDISPASEC